jgi:hypothetical protein
MKFADVNAMVLFATREAKLPEWQTKLFEKYRNEIKVHSRGELFFKLDTLFPNEHPSSKNHRVRAFESVTKGSFWKGVNNVQQIFQNSSYSVSASKNTVDYVSQVIFDEKNFFEHFLEQWCKNALANDPNSLMVVYPFEYVKEKGVKQLQFISSEHIKYRDNETVIFISESESETDYSIQKSRVTEMFFDQSIDKPNYIETTKNTFAAVLECKIKKAVYHVFTEEGFYRFQQKEGTTDEYEVEYWLHKQKFLPIEVTGGRDDGNTLFESFFSVFCPFGNLALLQHSQHTAVNFTYSFPRMSEVEVPCPDKNCSDGIVPCEISNEHPLGRMNCKVCRGTGYTTNQSPYKVYRKRLEPNTMDENVARAVLNSDDVKFYTPETSILDYSKNEWKDYLEFAESAVYVSQKVKTGNVESEGSKEQDFKDRYNWLSSIAKSFYPKLRAMLQYIENYLNANPVTVAVEVPYSLAIIGEGEAFETLQGYLNSDIAVMIKANQVEAFVNKYISQSSPVRKAFSVLKRVDLLLFYNDLNITGWKASGIITAEQWATHVFAFPVLYRLYSSDKSILDLPEDAIQKKLEDALVEYMPKKEDLKTNLLKTVETL